MYLNIRNTFFVLSVTMLASFSTTVLIGKNLTITQFGEFSFLKQILIIGSSISVFGLDHGLIKKFYNYKFSSVLHLTTIIVIILFSLLFVLLIALFYKINLIKIILIYICVFFGALSLYLSSIYRINNYFVIAQIINSGWKIILMFLTVAYILFYDYRNDIDTYLLFTISIIFPVFIFGNILFKRKKIEQDSLSIKSYLSFGLIFWLINSVTLISGGLDKLIIPLIYDNETLGIFTGISFLFIISLTMVGSSIGYILFPKITKGEIVNLKKIFLFLFLLSIFSLIFFNYTGKFFISFLLNGKYDLFINNNLIIIFTLIGILQIFHTIGHFLLLACIDKNKLFFYWLISILFMISNVFALLYIKSILISSIISIAIVFLIVRFFKVLIIYLLLFKSRKIYNWEINSI